MSFNIYFFKYKLKLKIDNFWIALFSGVHKTHCALTTQLWSTNHTALINKLHSFDQQTTQLWSTNQTALIDKPHSFDQQITQFWWTNHTTLINKPHSVDHIFINVVSFQFRLRQNDLPVSSTGWIIQQICRLSQGTTFFYSHCKWCSSSGMWINILRHTEQAVSYTHLRAHETA